MRNIKGQFTKGHKKIPNSSTFKKGHKVHGGFSTEAQLGEKHYKWKGGIGTRTKIKYSLVRPKSEQCEICGAMGKICYDHDHKTGKFRGWICSRCNLTLGMVKDNTELLDSMIKYIKK